MKSHYRVIASAVAAIFIATPSLAATLTALSTFGGGDGWRAPNEIVAGDAAGTATGSNYNYLQTGSLERGIAYNSATGNLVLVSRSSVGNGIRLLNGTTGADVGALAQAGVPSGGTFVINMPAAPGDGSVYVANLQGNVNSAAFKIYRWANEGAAAPTVFFDSTVAGFAGASPRLGDTLDVTGSGAGTTFVAGANGSTGYAIIDSAAAPSVITTFVPPGPSVGDFRLGVTFGPNANTVYGKQTSQGMEVTSYAGTFGASLATNVALTSAGEAPMDFAVVGGVPVLAVLDVNNSVVRVYNVSDPAAPLLLTSATTTSGTLAANGNGVGSVQFGAISGGNAVLYAMATNQGIQAFELRGVPEPGTLSLLAAAAFALVAAGRGRLSSHL
jgi:hypothetical protein